MHKFVHHKSKLPSAFLAYFDKNKIIHQYNTRQKDDFHTHSVQSEVGKRAIKFKGCKLWNSLPVELKEIESCFSFKYRLKNHLLHLL